MTRCKVCGAALDAATFFCSDACRITYIRAAAQGRPRKGHKRTLPPRACLRAKCGKTYTPYVARQKYCCRACHAAENNRACRARLKARRLNGNSG